MRRFCLKAAARVPCVQTPSVIFLADKPSRFEVVPHVDNLAFDYVPSAMPVLVRINPAVTDGTHGTIDCMLRFPHLLGAVQSIEILDSQHIQVSMARVVTTVD